MISVSAELLIALWNACQLAIALWHACQLAIAPWHVCQLAFNVAYLSTRYNCTVEFPSANYCTVTCLSIVVWHVCTYPVYNCTAEFLSTNYCTVTCLSIVVWHVCTYPVQLEHEALRGVTYIGLSISLVCLLLTIIFFMSYG